MSWGRREDKSPGQDVLRSVAVGMVGVTTRNAPEDRLALAVLRCGVATAPALLGRVPRIDEEDSSAAGGRLVLEASGKDGPVRPLDRPVEPGVGRGPVGEKRSGLFGIGLGFRSTDHIRDPEVFQIGRAHV